MLKKSLIALMLLTVLPAGAQLRLPQRNLQPVKDPAMVLIDRGARLEVLPTQRLVTALDATSHHMVRRPTQTSSSTPLDAGHLGVVFNHALQRQGYITGEIAFKVKNGRSFEGIQYPGLRQVLAPSLYVVNARTPTEFIRLVKELQSRTDLEWVQPTVSYATPP